MSKGHTKQPSTQIMAHFLGSRNATEQSKFQLNKLKRNRRTETRLRSASEWTVIGSSWSLERFQRVFWCHGLVDG